MPKTVESKLIFKGEDMLSPKLEHIIETLERLGTVVERVSAKFEALGQATLAGAAVGKDGVGRAAQGAGRSSFAPHPGEAEDRKKRGDKNAFRPYPGWHSGFRFAGGMIGLAGGMLGATQHQLMPVVGGALSAAGGAISPMAWGLGGIAGIPMMMGGGLMTGISAAAGPAMAHYQQYGDTYRLLGEDKAKQLRWEGAETFTPDEVMKFGAQLHRVGATEGFGTMAATRYGPVSPDMMAKYFETASTTGAAGARTRQDYDRLARTIYNGFGRQLDKNGNLVSMEESLDTLQGLMGISADYLGDIKDDQQKRLTGLTAQMAAGPAILRGQRGVQMMAGMAARMAGEGTDAEEMVKWAAYQRANPGGNYMSFLDWKADITRAPGDYLRGLNAKDNYDVLEAMRMLGLKSPDQARTVIKGYQESDAAGKRAMDEIEKGKSSELPGAKPSGTKADEYLRAHVGIAQKQMEVSEKIMTRYMEEELKMWQRFEKVFTGLHIDTVFDKFSKAVDKFFIATGLDEATPAQKAETRAELQRLGIFFSGPMGPLLAAVVKWQQEEINRRDAEQSAKSGH